MWIKNMMADSGIDSQSSPENDSHPVSRTHQYRKVMKPMLERKRRARINKCLDELKDLMVGALQMEGESITKLEKADVLELTVRHLRKLKAHGTLGLTPSATYAERYRAGYQLCAAEVSKFVGSGAAGVDVAVSARLLHHLSSCIRNLESVPSSLLALPPVPPHPHPGYTPPSSHPGYTPPSSPHDHLSGAPPAIRSLAEYLNPSNMEALRNSLSSSVSQSLATTRPTSAPAGHALFATPHLGRGSTPPGPTHLVRADISVMPTLPDRDDDRAWRPW